MPITLQAALQGLCASPRLRVSAEVCCRARQEARPEFRPAGLPWDWHLPAVPRLPSHRPSEALRPRQTMREMLSQLAPRREPRLASLTTAAGQ